MAVKKLTELHLWKDNPRGIKKTDFVRLKSQITKLGLYKPFLITPDGEILGGNMRYRACQELGITDVPVSVVEPKSEAQKLEYALSDNDRAGYYEEDQLAELIDKYKDEIQLEDYTVDLGKPTSLDDLLDRYSPVEEDDVPEVAEGEATSKLGEIYTLGKHRLMCGDATKIEDVEKLMDGKKADMVFTDPPYGIDADKMTMGTGKKDFYRGDWDNSRIDVKFLLGLAPKVCIWGGNYFTDVLPITNDWLCWHKKNDGLSFSEFELAWTNFGNNCRHISHHWGNEKKEHVTMKPVSVCVWGIKQGGKTSIVLDAFGGSGSTLIACEQTDRICYMMELDPKYVDVIRKRYENYKENH